MKAPRSVLVQVCPWTLGVGGIFEVQGLCEFPELIGAEGFDEVGVSGRVQSGKVAVWRAPRSQGQEGCFGEGSDSPGDLRGIKGRAGYRYLA